MLVLLAGCSGLLLNAQQGSNRDNLSAGVLVSNPSEHWADNALASLQIRSGSLTSSTGCQIHYRLFFSHPDNNVTATSTFGETAQADKSQPAKNHDLVILAHGFLRNQQRMQGLAARIAAAGYPVATLDFCNQRFWKGAHEQNAHDMIALANHLGAERRLYAGFSAGGLSALLAGREDAQAQGVLTLDLVDAGTQGQAAARDLEPPLLGIAGAPTNCNALNNADPVFDVAARSSLKRLPKASHCDFESPTDALCQLVCTDPDKGEASAPMHASLNDGDAIDFGNSPRRLGAALSHIGVSNTDIILDETIDAVCRLFDPDPLAWLGWKNNHDIKVSTLDITQ